MRVLFLIILVSVSAFVLAQPGVERKTSSYSEEIGRNLGFDEKLKLEFAAKLIAISSTIGKEFPHINSEICKNALEKEWTVQQFVKSLYPEYDIEIYNCMPTRFVQNAINEKKWTATVTCDFKYELLTKEGSQAKEQLSDDIQDLLRELNTLQHNKNSIKASVNLLDGKKENLEQKNHQLQQNVLQLNDSIVSKQMRIRTLNQRIEHINGYYWELKSRPQFGFTIGSGVQTYTFDNITGYSVSYGYIVPLGSQKSTMLFHEVIYTRQKDAEIWGSKLGFGTYKFAINPEVHVGFFAGSGLIQQSAGIGFNLGRKKFKIGIWTDICFTQKKNADVLSFNDFVYQAGLRTLLFF